MTIDRVIAGHEELLELGCWNDDIAAAVFAMTELDALTHEQRQRVDRLLRRYTAERRPGDGPIDLALRKAHARALDAQPPPR